MIAKTTKNPERELWVFFSFPNSVQETEKMQADDHDQRYACKPEDDIACHYFSPS